MRVYCILGDERAYRLKSSLMFSNVLKQQGIKGSYVPFKVAPDQIGQALQSLKVLNIAGANITLPYKEAVIPYLDILSEGANIIRFTCGLSFVFLLEYSVRTNGHTLGRIWLNWGCSKKSPAKRDLRLAQRTWFCS